MHAARLVEYSDSEDDEENQWREYHKQRSTLRMPPSVGVAAAVRSASFQSKSAMETDPQTPMRTTADNAQQQQPHSALSSSSPQSDRDYAFTPRKRSTFLRAAAMASSSPYSRKPAQSTAPLSPQADFSFSFPPSSTSASPMSDGDSKPFVWAPSSFQTQNANSNGVKEESGVSAGATSRTNIFTFGSTKTAEGEKTVKSEKVAQPPSAVNGFESAGPSPFKFDAFFKTVDAKPSPVFQAPAVGRSSSRAARADTKTPQRQKDLHRAAKRRVSGGGGGLSGFGGTPSSPASTPSPFSFVSSIERDIKLEEPSTPARKVLSPMDVPMDESAASPAFFFGNQTPPPPTKQPVFSSTPSQDSRSSRRSIGSRGGHHGTRNGISRGKDMRRQNIPETKAPDEPFVFGSTKTSKFPSRFSFVDTSAASTPFSFGSPINRSDSSSSESKTDTHPPLERKTSSFTFEEAFKEFQTNAREFKPVTEPPSSATSNPEVTKGGTTQASPFSASYPTLAARLQRRRQTREAHSRSTQNSFSSGSDTTPRRMGAQKSLFGAVDAADSFTDSASSKPASAEPNGNTTFNNSKSFVFGDVKSEPTRMTTNVFQKPSSTGNRSTTAWSFVPPASQPRVKKEAVFGDAQFNQGGVFSFSRSSEVSAPPEPQATPPPFENLKSNFDGFNIGMTPREKSKSAKVGLRKPLPASKAEPADEVVRSPFGMPVTEDSAPPFQQKSSAFVGTPPADPFVTPIFGQKKAESAQAPKAKQGLGFQFGEPSRSPFVHTPSTASPAGGSKANGAGGEAGTTTSSPFGTSFSMGASLFGQRRILRAARPAKQSQAASATCNDGGEEESHRKWSDWKLLGGEAYSNREYQQAADCYLNSTNALETLLVEHPELKTDQLMKDKAKLHSNRAAALMMLLQMSDAQRECYLSIDSDPGYTRAFLRLGRIQVMLGDVTGAKESATTAKQLLSLDHGGRNWRDSNDLAGVKKIELGVENLERLRGEIKWSLDVHDYTTALLHLNEALAIAPSCRSLQTQKAQVLFDQKNYSEVIDYCVGVIRKQKSNARSPARAKPAASPKPTTAEESKDDNDVALLGIELSLLRIRALHHESKEDEAMQHMHKLELAAPVSEKVIQLKRLLHDMKELKHQANASFKRGDYAKAQQLYTQALALDPTHDEYCAVLYCNRAAALMGLHQYENALHDCNAALRRKARYPRGLLRRARCNVALKRYAAAIADFDRYLVDIRQEAASSAGSYAEIEREKKNAEQALENEAQERRRKEEQQKKERQRNYGRAKSQQQQQQRRQSRHAWDDSKFYEEFWRSSSTGGASSSQNQHSSSGAKGNRANAAAHSKHQRTHYEILGIAKSSSQDEIKKAYRKLALLHHPDKAKDTVHADLFKDMTAAYNVLSDTTARAKYDRELQYGGYGRYYEY